MCVIISQPPKGFLPEVDMRNAMRTNAHGFGYAYYDETTDRIIAEKDITYTPEKMLEVWEQLKDKEVIYHFRIRTRGPSLKAQCHPFQVLSKDDGDPFDMWFAHNGTIMNVKEEGDESDTMAFNRIFLKPILKRDPLLIETPAFQELIKHFIGTSKLCFIYDKGKKVVINPQAGTKRGECWVSNDYSFRNDTTVSHSRNMCSTSHTAYYSTSELTELDFFGEKLTLGRKVRVYSNSNLDFSCEGEVTGLFSHQVKVTAQIDDGVVKDITKYPYYFSTTTGDSIFKNGEYYFVAIKDNTQKKSQPSSQKKKTTVTQEFLRAQDSKKEQTNGQIGKSSGVTSTNDEPDTVTCTVDGKTHFLDPKLVWGYFGVSPNASYSTSEMPGDDDITIADYTDKSAQERFEFFLNNPLIMFLMMQDLIGYFEQTFDYEEEFYARVE